MAGMDYPLGPFRPDVADTNPGLLRDLANATLKPDANGVAYGPLPSLLVSDDAVALPSAPKGHLTCVTAGGVYKTFVATEDSIYEVSASGAHTLIGSGFALPAGDKWGRCQFGKYAIFTNTADGMWKYDIEVGGAMTLVANAPAARIVKVIFNTLFALDCDGDNKTMRCADIADMENWTPNTGTAQRDTFPTGEALMGIEEVVDGLAILMQRNAIRLVQRIDSGRFYVTRLLAENQGAANPWCIQNVNGWVYYWDAAGPRRVNSGGVQAIGAEKVDEWLQARMSAEALRSVESAYDPRKELVRSRYATDDPDVFSEAIDYDLNQNEFVPIEETTAAIYTTASPGYTMEELDQFVDGGGLDGLSLSLDDRFWFGGEAVLGGVDGDLKPGFFEGPNLAARFETNTSVLSKSISINRATPITDADDVTLSVGQSEKLSAALTYTTAAGTLSDGTVPLGGRGKNITMKMAIPAGSDWTFARGVDFVEAVK